MIDAHRLINLRPVHQKNERTGNMSRRKGMEFKLGKKKPKECWSPTLGGGSGETKRALGSPKSAVPVRTSRERDDPVKQ